MSDKNEEKVDKTQNQTKPVPKEKHVENNNTTKRSSPIQKDSAAVTNQTLPQHKEEANQNITKL